MVARVCFYARSIPRCDSKAADVASFEQSVAYSTDTKLLNQVYGQQVKRFLAVVLDHQKSYVRAGLELLSKDICHEHLQLTKRMKSMVKKL